MGKIKTIILYNNDPTPNSKKHLKALQIKSRMTQIISKKVSFIAGKATGKYLYHLNIQSPKDKEISSTDVHFCKEIL